MVGDVLRQLAHGHARRQAHQRYAIRAAPEHQAPRSSGQRRVRGQQSSPSTEVNRGHSKRALISTQCERDCMRDHATNPPGAKVGHARCHTHGSACMHGAGCRAFPAISLALSTGQLARRG